MKERFSLKETLYIDLLNPELANQLSAYPNRLIEIILPHLNDKKWIIIDEIQKVPSLLEIVHQQISQKNFNFALTGSSARKLRRGAANLLAGRAFVFNLFPLTHLELGDDFDLDSSLAFGSLPEVCNLKDKQDKRRFLKAYVHTYLKEEIIVEQIVRNLPPFRRFLDVAGAYSTEMVNYTNIAKDVHSDPKTISRYYEILEDTLVGFYLPGYSRSLRKQQRKAKKFYFFDSGVVRTLSGRIDEPLLPKTTEYGQLFENFIVNEIHRLLNYSEKTFNLSYIRVSERIEIDLVVEKGSSDIFLCEIKSTNKVDERHTYGLKTLAKDFKNPRSILISLDPVPKKFGDITALPWKEAVRTVCA